MKTVSEKMGVRSGMRTYLFQSPVDVQLQMALPDVSISTRLTGKFDYIHFFAKDQADLAKNFDRFKQHLDENGMLWISWRKRSRAAGHDSDLNIKNVIEIGYNHGLVESKAIAVTDDWSAPKFTWPKAAKVYNNSYGKLK